MAADEADGGGFVFLPGLTGQVSPVVFPVVVLSPMVLSPLRSAPSSAAVPENRS